MSKESTSQERTVRRLRLYLWCGIFYLIGAIFWVVGSHLSGEFEPRVAILWIIGSMGFNSPT